MQRISIVTGMSPEDPFAGTFILRELSHNGAFGPIPIFVIFADQKRIYQSNGIP